MKIRTTEELLGKLDEALSWRKKELIDYKLITERNKGSLLQKPLTRAGIALVYAHWEGFIKEASGFYLSYLSSLKLKPSDISLNLLTLSIFDRIIKANDVDKCYTIIQFLNDTTSRCKMPQNIDTESNLKSNVLKKIMFLLDLNYTHYETRANFIDANLLGKRNEIAHGEFRNIDYSEFEEVFDFVIKYSEIYKNEIINSAIQKKYYKTKHISY
ncbi:MULTISPECIES: MAE_28990/MAE_18760 family HEPN-like nuclease [Butyricimonas]|uniref:MAE_28990/MAE_18760 family HEPN-like nuclease n=1 Tax=Butyricimonas TaxID=574697 RepID=UPI0022E3E3F2|nr:MULTISPECIES: MAE_28990/MAE_18760 family HEPN-like nuclease [Butyricimonas]